MEFERARHAEQSERVTRFVKNMRALREQKRWSVAHLSDVLLGQGTPIVFSVLTNLENARRATLTLDEALAIAAALKTTLSWLCDFDGPACTHCLDHPPDGYRCQACGAEGDVRFQPMMTSSPREDKDV